MNRSTYRFTLDLQKHRSQMSIAVFVHDSAVRLIISLTDGGIPYHIESGGRAVFYGKRPDDTPLCHNCMIDDTGRIIYDFNDQTASVEGITDCQIRIYGRSRELVSAPRFIIVADERPVNDADIEKQEDSPLAALDEIQFAEIERVDAETARAEAEKARADAEAERITNEQARIDAEAVRIKNENERIDAEAERIKNEEARIEAETAQNQKISELEGNITDNERRLNEIEEHLAPKYIITDDKTAYRKDVPANACSKAQLNSIGGMSYKTDNLLPLKYSGFASSDSVTDRGCTFTNNGDGGIALSGTPTGAGTVSLGYLTDINTDKITASVSGTFTNASLSLSIYDANGLIGSAIRVTAETVIDLATDYPNAIRISASIVRRSDSGGELSGVIYPMVNKGDVALPHSLSFEGLRDSAVTELKAHGANLIPFPYKDTSKTEKGVTYTVNEDGTVVLNGTSTARYVFSIAIFSNLTAGKRYTLSGCPSGGSTDSTYAIYVSAFLNGVWQNEFFDKGSSVSFTAQEGFIYNVYISVWKENIQFNNLTFKPMLNYGDTALPYEPFKEAETVFQIPAKLRAFLEQYGYGRGVNANYHNYIDYERKVFVQKTKRIVFNGTENWQLYDASGKYRLVVGITETAHFVDNNTVSSCICNFYNAITSAQTYLAKRGVSIAPAQIFIYDENYQEVTKWKAHLAELYANGNPLVIEYALAEPIETDISDYIDNNIIKVTAGGSIEFVSDSKKAVPSSVSYMMGGHLLAKEV